MTDRSTTFLRAFGFSESPFSSTNADREPDLARYFVPPPYFASVKGSASDPRSAVILAPRGGGKTAQKVMIEEYAEAERRHPFLCIAYDTFRPVDGNNLKLVTLDWHLIQIIQRVLAGVVALINQGHGASLTKSEKRLLAYCFQRFLGELTHAEAAEAFRSVKSLPERARDFVGRHGRNIVAVVSAIAGAWGISKFELDKTEAELRQEPLTYVFQRLIELMGSFGFASVYVLIDRVDEVPEVGNDSERSFKFIEPVITNLALLEMPGCAFKVFMWDKTEDHLISSTFRRDRVPSHALNWTQSELEDMLSKRVAAFSGGAIKSINQLLAADVRLDVHKLVCLLSRGSPRDVIRLVARVVDEHTRVQDQTNPISRKSVEAGIKKFSRERSLELYGSRVEDLAKIDMVSFTIGDVANDVFRISHQAARQKIQNLMNLGAILKSGEIENPGNRPLHQYSLADPRLAFVVLAPYDLETILNSTCFVCPRCKSLLVREGPEVACDDCSLEFSPKENDTLLAHCAPSQATPTLNFLGDGAKA